MRVSKCPFKLTVGLMVLTLGRAASAQSGGQQTGGGQGEVGADTAAEGDDALPAGHPAIADSNPHGHAASGDGTPGVFQPPEDTEQADPTMPPGSISVDLRDADERPIATGAAA